MIKHKYNNEVDEAYVYTRIGMALVSAQRVEFVTGQLLELLAEFDKDIYGVTTSDFHTKHYIMNDISFTNKINAV